MIIRHTDAEVLAEIAAILWPPSDPNRPWSSDTVQEVADALLLLRPELQPWSFNCLVDHGWAGNAFDCASQRRYTALVSFVRGEGPGEAIDHEDDTVNALRELTYGTEDDD